MFPSKVPRVVILTGLVLLLQQQPSSPKEPPPVAPPGAGSKNEVSVGKIEQPPAAPPAAPAAHDDSPAPNADSKPHDIPQSADAGLEPPAASEHEALPPPPPPPAAAQPSGHPGAADDHLGTTPPPPPAEPPKFEHGDEHPIPPPNNCPTELNFLAKTGAELHLSSHVKYNRRCIQPIFSSEVDRNEVVNISTPLTGEGKTTVDMKNCAANKLPKCIPIKLTVPKPYPEEKFNNMIFGISTGYDRLNDASSVATFAHWMAGTDAQLIALVTDMPERSAAEIRALNKRFGDANIKATLVRALDDSFTTSQSHFTVLVHMLNHTKPETQWYGLLDDDTFFPNLKPLADALAKFDHNKDYYIGTLSEDFAAVRNFGYMAFGGAGAYLSAALAQKLGDNALKCIEEATAPEGDIIIRDCVYRHSKAKLTILDELWQQDLMGDPSGFFESGVRPINLHHWKSWFHLRPERMSLASDFCGDCFLQRWRFGTDEVLSNGYSIAKYSDGLEELDLNFMEKTASNLNDGFDFSIGPFRPLINPDKKKSFLFEDANIDDKGVLRQLYVWRGNAEAGEMDEVIELVWKK
ncbi:glycosyltransferase family 31 protein [Apiospora phragmitis]|uniref:Glycosyltransferase family 31 protein n=1 Tax=Apiospora phragmitis TaxID=2905665 RepID=A0ABR1W0M3_9PEZI